VKLKPEKKTEREREGGRERGRGRERGVREKENQACPGFDTSTVLCQLSYQAI